MANMKIFSKIVGDIAGLKKFIIKSITDRLNATLFSQTSRSAEFVKNTILESIRRQDEYSSLKSGRLRNMFGIQNSSDVDLILSEIENMSVDIKKPTSGAGGINARISISMIRNNFADLLSSPAASYTSENGFPVNWLEWLLLRGNDSVVIGYRYLPKSSPFSRTGTGIMIEGDSAIFRVPPEYAGNLDNNWITRGIDEALPTIESYFNKLVEKAL